MFLILRGIFKISQRFYSRLCVEFVAIIALSVFIVGCQKSPADQCLESFEDNLVSPNSAKVFKFENGRLSYLSKNRMGVEIQGRAICSQIGEKWVRDSLAEKAEAMKLANDTLEANNNCRSAGTPRSVCDSLKPVIELKSAFVQLGYE